MRRYISPLTITGVSYLYVAVIVTAFYLNGVYNDNRFFRVGPPVRFFGHDFTSWNSFVLIIGLVFVHQLVNNCVNSVVYPWIMNSVQDPKNKTMEYSNAMSLLIINLFDLYSQVDMVLIVMGFMSQISFVGAVVAANVITSTYINLQYLREKRLSDTSRLLDIV